jgi:hypothetical protein
MGSYSALAGAMGALVMELLHCTVEVAGAKLAER